MPTNETLEIYGALCAPFAETHKLPKGGVELDYLAGEQVVSRLNDVLGVDGWDFEIKEHGREENTYWVLGRLTIERTIREQFGECQSSRGMAGGDARKGAATDALKKCASLIGVGLYLSHKDGLPVAETPEGPVTCADCDTTLEDIHFKNGDVWTVAKIAQAGRSKFGKALCMPHYRAAKAKAEAAS